MGRKFRLGAVIASVLVVGSVAVASATSSPDSRSSDSDGRKVLVLDLLARVVGNSTYIDEGTAGESVGDQYVAAVDLFSGGHKVGEESSICTVTRIQANGATTLHCTGFSSLPGGQVTSEVAYEYGPGEQVKKDPYFTAVKGGTGKYRTAHGEGRIQELAVGEWRITFRIIL